MRNERDAICGKSDQEPAVEHMPYDQSCIAGPVGQLAAALAKAQATIQPATKTGVNPHYGNRYADLASVWAACRDSLTRNRIAVVQMPDYDPTVRCVSVTTILLHASGEYIVSTVRTPIAKADAQGVDSAVTYLRRYALAAFVGVAPDDDDGEAASRPMSSPPENTRQEAEPQSAVPAVWPLGRTKGTLLKDFTEEDLHDRREWCQRKDRKTYAMLIKQIDEELAARGAGNVDLTS